MNNSSDERCLIPKGDLLYQKYHDAEWGLPIKNDTRLFEKVCLEGFQSGLSWRTILHRREGFRLAFDNFDIHTVATYSDAKINQLAENPDIIRNRQKIKSAINNAKRALELQTEFGSLGTFFWQFEPKADDRPTSITPQWLAANPTSPESTALSHALKLRGWSYVGPVNMYALMQALGIVNDHVNSCPVRTKVEYARECFVTPQQAVLDND